MRRLRFIGYAALTVFASLATVHAQVPRTISYQGLLSDSLGQPKADGVYSFMFKLYDASSGGSALWTETKSLQVSHGLFSTSLGDQTPVNLPSSEQYWLGITLGADPELQPRIPLNSTGYSLRSLTSDSTRIAGTVVDGAIGTSKVAVDAITSDKIAGHQVVKSFNGMTDGVTLRATGGALITSSGDTITINAGSGGGTTGIQTLQSSNGTINITNPNGPTATVNVKDQGIGTTQLANKSITLAKMDPSGATTGQVLKFNGSSLAWSPDESGGLVLPFTGNASTTANALQVSNSGSGSAGAFGIDNSSSTGAALVGITNGRGKGVFGQANSSIGIGVQGESTNGIGVLGSSSSDIGVEGSGSIGVFAAGQAANSAMGVLSNASGSNSISVQAVGTNYGVWGGGGNIGVYAHNTGGSSAGRDVYLATQSLAADMYGNVYVHGTVTQGSTAIRIDNPTDPANKYLNHSAVESADMKTMYDGVATLDASGKATVTLPSWFEALNKDFRYQLTAIGAPGPNLYIAQKVSGNAFVIAGGPPGMEVSWLVTGIRQDAWAKAHPIPVEEDKPVGERGFYEHPELFGQPESRSVLHAFHPESQAMQSDQEQLMRKMKAASLDNSIPRTERIQP